MKDPRRSRLTAAGFDPALHPHRPGGSSRGGQWAPKVGDQISGTTFKGQDIRGEVVETSSHGPVVQSASDENNVQTVRPETAQPVGEGQAAVPAISPDGPWTFKQKHSGLSVRITKKGEIYGEATTHTNNPHIPSTRTYKLGSTKDPVKYAQKKINDGVWEHV